MMTRREIAARFSGTMVGSLWIYAQPVLTIAIYYLVFGLVLQGRLPDNAPTQNVGLYLMVSMLPWMAYSDAVSRGMTSLIEAGNLLQKNALVPVLFPARSVATSAITFIPPALLVAAIAMTQQGASVSVVLLPVLWTLQFLLSFLLSYLLAVLASAMRDVIQVVNFLMSLGVFTAPILYTPEMIPASLRWLLWLNPMTPLVLAYQDVLLTGRVPGPELWLAVAAWIGLAGLGLGFLVKRASRYLVDWL